MCILEFPDLELLWQEYRSEGLQVVGVWAYQTTFLEPVIAQTGVSFPIGIPKDQRAMEVYTATHYGVSPFPFQILVDRSGAVTYMASDYDAEALRKAIEMALGPEGTRPKKEK